MISKEELKTAIEQYKKDTGRTMAYICRHVATSPAQVSSYLNDNCGLSEFKKCEIMDFIIFDTAAHERAEAEWENTNTWRKYRQ